jgi:hypothetical protein
LVARLSGGQLGTEVIAPVLFISAIDAPVYVAISVRDCVVVDRFLNQLDKLLAKATRGPTNGDMLSIETDFYLLSDTDQRVRCFAIGAFGLRFRVFAARIDKALYLTSQPFVLHDLAQQYTTEPAPQGVPSADTAAHFLVRIRPRKWSRVLDDYRLGWAEGNRRSCLHNLGPLNGFARAYDLPSDRLLDVAEQLNGVRYFCPEGGQYHWVPSDAGAPGRMCCTIHGSASHPRQSQAPIAGSRIDQLLAELQSMTAALTFTDEGLRAVLRIERKSPDR